MIKLILQSLALLAITLGLMLGLVYAPDYLNYVPWEPKFITMSGAELSDPLDTVETGVAFVTYWDVECKFCAQQQQILRQFVLQSGSGMVTLVYVNPYNTVQEIEQYITELEEPKVDGVPELWMRGTEILMVNLPYVTLWMRDETGVWVAELSWEGRKTIDEVYALLQPYLTGNE